jgi:hypothetical protein
LWPTLWLVLSLTELVFAGASGLAIGALLARLLTTIHRKVALEARFAILIELASRVLWNLDTRAVFATKIGGTNGVTLVWINIGSGSRFLPL